MTDDLRKSLSELADEWEQKYGPGSENERVFGPQSVSIEFVVQKVRDLLAAHPSDEATVEACANHHPRQHRDGRPPWCDNCQRDNRPPSSLDRPAPAVDEEAGDHE
ncbi:MAG TPA: hypothetical protein VJL80_06250 [Aeromicrobium sp.]|nr:hypothetical protein [Aeromicrobium sp.]HKY57620.1 hypothetical protein [Aeromicrobium sp.]